MRYVAYVHTPMRYAWDMWPLLFPAHRPAVAVCCAAGTQLSTHLGYGLGATRGSFVANSQFVAQRIAKYYRRRARVMYPPVDTELFTPGKEWRDYYLMVSALVPYKGLELAIRAFNAFQRPLKITGSGPLAAQLQALVPLLSCSAGVLKRGSGQVLCCVSGGDLPTQEDFGIVPLGANAAGRPVIALEAGGALETIIPANDIRSTGTLGPRADCVGASYRGSVYVADTRGPAGAVRFFEAHDAFLPRGPAPACPAVRP